LFATAYRPLRPINQLVAHDPTGVNAAAADASIPTHAATYANVAERNRPTASLSIHPRFPLKQYPL
jgi:hypothetical protein